MATQAGNKFDQAVSSRVASCWTLHADDLSPLTPKPNSPMPKPEQRTLARRRAKISTARLTSLTRPLRRRLQKRRLASAVGLAASKSPSMLMMLREPALVWYLLLNARSLVSHENPPNRDCDTPNGCYDIFGSTVPAECSRRPRDHAAEISHGISLLY